MTLLLLLAGPALAGPIAAGERLEWSVSWMGIDAGTAWATTASEGAGWRLEAGCRSAGWLASMYPIDDHLLSEWAASGGSARYTTRFREGHFEQDQDMRFAADAVTIARNQHFDEGWRASESRYPAAPGAEDPVSAFYRVRVEAGPVGERVHLVVWTGRKPEPVTVWTAAAEPLDGKPALRVEVLAGAGTDDLEPKMTVWLSDDADRVPLAAVLHTHAGAVRATLTGRTLADGAVSGEASTAGRASTAGATTGGAVP